MGPSGGQAGRSSLIASTLGVEGDGEARVASPSGTGPPSPLCQWKQSASRSFFQGAMLRTLLCEDVAVDTVLRTLLCKDVTVRCAAACCVRMLLRDALLRTAV